MANNSKNETPLLNVYLIVGEDSLKRDTVMKRLSARLSALGDLSFNSDTFSGINTTGQDIVVACNTVPFLSPVRLVEVHSVDKLKKEDSEALVSYLDSPCPTTILALVSEKLAKNTRLYKAVARQGSTAIIDCSPLTRRELPRAIRSMAVGQGFTLTEGAAVKLLELVGESTVHLNNELKKIGLAHVGTDPVTEQEVEAFVPRTTEVKRWEFVNAFAARDVCRCFIYLENMSSTSPYALLGSCTSCLRELICARTMLQRGTPHAVAGALGIPDWRAKNSIMWAKGFSDKELREAIISSRETERIMKSGGDPDAEFRIWMTKTISHKR